MWLFGVGDSGARDDSDMVEGAGERMVLSIITAVRRSDHKLKGLIVAARGLNH